MEEYYESPYDKLRREPPDRKTWKAVLIIRLDQNATLYGKSVTLIPDDYPELIFYSQFGTASSGAALFSPVPEGNYTVTVEGFENEKHITLNNRITFMEWL